MATQNKRKRRRSAEQWGQLLRRHAESGQSVEAFCRGEGISPASFYRWRRQLAEGAAGAQSERNGPSTPAFVDLGRLSAAGRELGDPGTTATGAWELELALGSGLVLRLRGH
jgi:transposase-like protein